MGTIPCVIRSPMDFEILRTHMDSVKIATPADKDSILAAILDVLTAKTEDVGEGAYEYGGARGVHSQLALVIQEDGVYLDITQLYRDSLDEDATCSESECACDLPISMGGRLLQDDRAAYFIARKSGEPFYQEGRLLQEYQIIPS